MSILTPEEVAHIAVATKSADPGRDGYILPNTFAAALESAIVAKLAVRAGELPMPDFEYETETHYAHPSDAFTADALRTHTAAMAARVEVLERALRGLLSDTQHAKHKCGDPRCPVDAARAALTTHPAASGD